MVPGFEVVVENDDKLRVDDLPEDKTHLVSLVEEKGSLKRLDKGRGCPDSDSDCHNHIIAFEEEWLKIIMKTETSTPLRKMGIGKNQVAVEENWNDSTIFNELNRSDFSSIRWALTFLRNQDVPLFDQRIMIPCSNSNVTQHQCLDKQSILYIMCLLNYSFSILPNAFFIKNPTGTGEGELDSAKLTSVCQDNFNKFFYNSTTLFYYQVLYGGSRDIDITKCFHYSTQKSI